MSIDIPSHKSSAEQEAIAYMLLAEHRAFARGFLQVTQLIAPAVPEGDLIEVANDFIDEDVDRFSHVDGMPDLFGSDDYKLGVVLGIWATRKKNEILAPERTRREAILSRREQS